MPSITTDLTEILRTIRCDGDYYASGSTEISPPNLEVEGVGLISLPFQQAQLEQLIARAERAPFGRGEHTVIDTDVRRTWQIGAEHLHFGGRNWPATLARIVASASAGLGVADPVSAQLYKLLIYDAGSFFVEHRDTEKTPGMFATLVIVLPSVYRGGELRIRHGEREVRLDLCCADPSDAAFVAFYADCVHEVLPITSGTRLTLVYNLIRSGKAEPASPPQYLPEQAQLVTLLKRWMADQDGQAGDAPVKLVYPLEHAYSAAELGFDTLKNADAALAKVLVAAAAQAGCEIHLGQVSIEESGAAEYSGDYRRGRYRYDDDEDEDEDEDDFEVVEINERSASIAEWRRPDGSATSLGALPLIDEELCPPDAFDDEDPDEQHFHEATGNEGASFERTYRRAALVLWPRARQLAVVNQGGLATTLPYLEDLVQRWCDSGAHPDATSWSEIDTLAAYMIRDWPGNVDHHGENAACMLACLAQSRNRARIDAFLSEISASGRYAGGENDNIARAVALLPPQRVADLVERIIAANATFAPSACADLLYQASAGRANVLFVPAATRLIDALLGTHVSASRPDVWRRPAAADARTVVNVLAALQRLDASALADSALEHMFASFPVDAALVPAALELAQDGTTGHFAPAQRLRRFVLEHLRARMAEPLEAPRDFARPAAIACQCEHCLQLARFLADPQRGSWVFKAAEALRRHVERSIVDNGCDLDRETVRRGSPYSLVCTKNQSSYERRVRQRAEDQANEKRLAADAPLTGV